jgi:hypothetical protein
MKSYPNKDILGISNSKITEKTKFQKEIKVGKSIYQNPHFNDSNVWLKIDYFTIGIAICLVLFAFF